jgi:hypothetical protein
MPMRNQVEFEIIGKCGFCERPVHIGSMADAPLDLLERSEKTGIHIATFNRAIGRLMICNDCAEGFYGMIEDIRYEVESAKHN